MPSRIPARKDAAAEKRALERVVAVVAAAAEAGDFARRVEAGDRLARRVEHLAVEIGVQAAERLAGQDVEPHGDQRAVRRIEDPVRLGGADQPVAEIVAGAVDGDDLRVLGERIVDLAVARLDLLAAAGRGRSASSPVSAFMPATRSRRSSRTMKSSPFSLKASTGGGAPAAAAALQHGAASSST